MKLTYVVVFEQTPNNYCAYVPDLAWLCQYRQTYLGGDAGMIKEAIEFHIEGIQLDTANPCPFPKCPWKTPWLIIGPSPTTTAATFQPPTTWKMRTPSPYWRLRWRSTCKAFPLLPLVVRTSLNPVGR